MRHCQFAIHQYATRHTASGEPAGLEGQGRRAADEGGSATNSWTPLVASLIPAINDELRSRCSARDGVSWDTAPLIVVN